MFCSWDGVSASQTIKQRQVQYSAAFQNEHHRKLQHSSQVLQLTLTQTHLANVSSSYMKNTVHTADMLQVNVQYI